MSNSNLEYVSLFSKDSVVVDGLITVPSHLKISGTVKMNIESAGKVVVTETGLVEGYIRAAAVQVQGKVTGNVISAGTVTISKEGRVDGKVAAGEINIEEGAVCNMEMAIGKEAIERRKIEWGKDSRIAAVGAREKDKVVKGVLPLDAEDQRNSNREAKRSENGKSPGNTTSKSSDENNTPASKSQKAGDLPDDKEWVDRFW